MGFCNPLFAVFCIIYVSGLQEVNALTTTRSQLGTSNVKFPNTTNQKIVGGFNAIEGDFPYQLSLRYRGRHFCGGSLIKVADIQLGITAAHCVEGIFGHPNALAIVAGDLTISDNNGNEQTRYAQSIIIHEKYGISDQLDNDIALIFLDKPFKLNKYVDLVGLPDENEEPLGNLTISGWGKLESEGGISDTLQYVIMPVVNHSICQDKWKHHPQYPIEIGNGILCSGVESGNMSACHGDSGGPAVNLETRHLAGIVSFGDPTCGHPDYPGGFTNVVYYQRWIEEKVENFKKFSFY